jgi:hypothetical protein
MSKGAPTALRNKSLRSTDISRCLTGARTKASKFTKAHSRIIKMFKKEETSNVRAKVAQTPPPVMPEYSVKAVWCRRDVELGEMN